MCISKGLSSTKGEKGNNELTGLTGPKGARQRDMKESKEERYRGTACILNMGT